MNNLDAAGSSSGSEKDLTENDFSGGTAPVNLVLRMR